MKATLFAVLLVCAGAFALPRATEDFESREARIIEGQIIRAIEDLKAAIRNAGLDPLIIDNVEYRQTIIPFLVEVSVFIDKLNFVGASDIVIYNVDYSLIFSRFRFDIGLPELALSVGDSGLDALVFGTRHEARFRGSSAVKGLRLAGEVNINIGIISGISIRNISIQFTLGGIDSDLTLQILGLDLSNGLNNILGVTIPETLLKYRAEINKFLEDVVLAIADRIL